MNRTPNLGLPQFEPSDKYRLEDYNEAYMKIDEKVKELKDKEAQLDTKLAEAQSIIDTWTQFKNSGGDIGGGIFASILKSWGDTMVDGDLWLSGCSRDTNGYTKLPNGMIMQWGLIKTTLTSDGQNITGTITLPIQFPNASLFAEGRPTFVDGGSYKASLYNGAVTVINNSTLQMYFMRHTNGPTISEPVDVTWIAI